MHVGGLDHGRVAGVPRLPAMFSGRRQVDGKTRFAYVATLPMQEVQGRKTGKLEAKAVEKPRGPESQIRGQRQTLCTKEPLR
jgi:hypothetical protein